MIYGSVCSGIEAATVAWHPLGWKPAFFAEIEAFPCAVLKHHYPEVPNRGDITRFKEWGRPSIDILVGGTPCQSFSVAGLRKGLDDPRGNLALTFLAIADALRPRWILWENVPGVLSSGEGRDFGSFLGGLGQLGYGWAYRVLDAQYFGVPQRRRRVFVVGHLGDWRRAAAVLFERESLSWNPPPSREAGKRTAACLTRGAESSGKGGYAGRRREDDENIVANALTERPDRGGGNSEGQRLIPEVCPALKMRDYKGPSSDGDGDGASLIPVVAKPLGAKPLGAKNNSGWRGDLDNETYIAHSLRGEGHDASEDPDAVAPTLAFASGTHGGHHQPKTMTGMSVRRLTPKECLRLQGFPDNYLDILYRGKPAADGPKYKAVGNSMAVDVIEWLGERIDLVERVS